MLLSYERGTPDQPKGHALAYFKDSSNPNDIYAAYLVVPPIAIDLAKYMPQMFANKMSLADLESVAAIPLPPVPEKVKGLRHLRNLAERREDDVIFMGTVNASDVQAMLSAVADASQQYLREFTASMERTPLPSDTGGGESSDTSAPGLSSSVDDVLFSMMNDRDKLGDLSKLVGKLRYAVEGNDKSLVSETVEQMEVLGRHLPNHFRVRDIIAAARTPGSKGGALSQLHIERCYKLSDQDFRAVEDIEARILGVEAQG